ncbi:MAG: hypothetical protein HW389_2624 [Bacteroidetes bacterium]|nr:hypothetical protein [Bacteroidota bacterium]MDP2886255.1 hypothetical protein [Ignavibacteria bacterium]
MISQTISYYSALRNPAGERNPRKRDKILEKLLTTPPSADLSGQVGEGGGVI